VLIEHMLLSAGILTYLAAQFEEMITDLASVVSQSAAAQGKRDLFRTSNDTKKCRSGGRDERQLRCGHGMPAHGWRRDMPQFWRETSTHNVATRVWSGA